MSQKFPCEFHRPQNHPNIWVCFENYMIWPFLYLFWIFNNFTFSCSNRPISTEGRNLGWKKLPKIPPFLADCCCTHAIFDFFPVVYPYVSYDSENSRSSSNTKPICRPPTPKWKKVWGHFWQYTFFWAKILGSEEKKTFSEIGLKTYMDE